jgi:hypothetical protein
MFSVSEADLIAVRHAHDTAGRVGALAELRRRFLGLSDRMVSAVLDRVLAMPVSPPPFAGKREARQKGAKQ